MIRQYALVRMKDEWFEDKKTYDNYTKCYPFVPHFRRSDTWDPNNDVFLYFLGEIPNMPGHCILIDCKGRVHPGFHMDSFEEIPEEDM